MRRIYLNRQHFAAMVCVALAVHIMLGVSWALAPEAKVNKVPVHVLNIKLGAGDSMAGTLSPVSMEESRAIAASVSRHPNPVPPPRENERQGKKEPAPAKKSPEPAKQAAKADPAPTERHVAQERGPSNRVRTVSGVHNTPLASDARPSQYVRAGDARGSADGSAIGNSLDAEAQIMQRYTQLISMWINRQKAVFDRAIQPGMRGNIVIRLRIDRSGKIHFFKLDKATGVPAVDAAAAEMVRAANPVPPAPSNYPGGNMFEFLIPVGYTFQQ